MLTVCRERKQHNNETTGAQVVEHGHSVYRKVAGSIPPPAPPAISVEVSLSKTPEP